MSASLTVTPSDPSHPARHHQGQQNKPARPPDRLHLPTSFEDMPHAPDSVSRIFAKKTSPDKTGFPGLGESPKHAFPRRLPFSGSGREGFPVRPGPSPFRRGMSPGPADRVDPRSPAFVSTSAGPPAAVPRNR